MLAKKIHAVLSKKETICKYFKNTLLRNLTPINNVPSPSLIVSILTGIITEKKKLSMHQSKYRFNK